MSNPNPKSAGTAIVTGCILLFGLPFLLAGIIMMLSGLVSLRNGLSLGDSAFAIFGGIAFTAVGLGVVLLAKFGRRKLEESARLRVAHPESPWMWDAGWAEGTLRSGDRGVVIVSWILAAAWNGISAPFLFFLPGELAEGNYAALIGLIFPLVGLGLLTWAIRATLRLRRYGGSDLILVHNPIPVGGTLAAAIRTRFDSPPAEMKFRLTCHERIRGSGDDGTTENLLWEEETTVPAESMRAEAGLTFVPVVFQIPADARPTDREGSPRTIHWRLRADAEVIGVDFSSSFEVPVFRTGEALVESSRAVAEAVERAEPEVLEPFDPSKATVTVSTGAGGTTVFRFGAGRVRGPALGLTIVALAFLGATYFMSRLNGPGLFQIVFGVLGLGLLGIAIDLWLVATVVEIGNSEIVIRNTVLGMGPERRIPIDEVEAVDLKIGLSQNESATQSPRAWYDIGLKLAGGRKLSAGRHVSSKREARWIVSQMRQVLGLAGRSL